MSEKVVQLNIRITESLMAQIESFQALKRYGNKRDAVEDLIRAGLAIATEDVYYGQLARYVDAIVTTRLHAEVGALAGRLDEMEDRILESAETACAIGAAGIAATVGEANRCLPAGKAPSDPGTVFRRCYGAGLRAAASGFADPSALRADEPAAEEWIEDEGDDW
jgi:hypothetical protein